MCNRPKLNVRVEVRPCNGTIRCERENRPKLLAQIDIRHCNQTIQSSRYHRPKLMSNYLSDIATQTTKLEKDLEDEVQCSLPLSKNKKDVKKVIGFAPAQRRETKVRERVSQCPTVCGKLVAMLGR